MRTRRVLTDDERKAIIIMANEGLSYPDIARIMQRPIGTISSIISRGILLGIIERRVEREDKRKE